MRNSMIERMKGVLGDGLATARRRGAEAAKIHFHQSEEIGCSFEAGRLKAAQTQQGASYTVTVLAGGKRGSASGTDVADLDEIISRAVTLAKVGSASHFAAWPAPGQTTAVERWSARTLGLTREQLIDGCRQVVDALKAYHADLFIEAGGHRRESEGLLVTTGGVCHSSAATGWSLGAWAQRTEGTDMLFAGFGRSWRDLNELYDPQAIIDHTLEDLRHGERTVGCPSGACTAVLSPEMLEMLLWAVELGVNGRNVAKGDSPLRGRLGEKVLDESLTLIDDPHVAFAPGAAEIDADGVPARKVGLFTNGVLDRFLYDLDSAGLAGAEPTGHDGCRPHYPAVLPGRRPASELIAGVADGIYLKQLLGFGQGNVINGDFSCNVALGFRIRNGEIVGRVKNVMAAGNVYELLAANVELSSDRDPVLRMPHAVVEGLHVAAAQE